MSFQLSDSEMQDMSEMNLIPLIDIMLVLMIIFMVTASVINPSVALDLPQTSAQVQPPPEHIIQISIDDNAQIFWDNQQVSMTELESRLTEQSMLDEQPTVRLHVDKQAKYETVAQVLAYADITGLNKIAFVSVN